MSEIERATLHNGVSRGDFIKYVAQHIYSSKYSSSTVLKKIGQYHLPSHLIGEI